MQTYRELKSLTKKELLKELSDARQALAEKKIMVKTGHQKDTSAVGKQKLYISRLCTALKELEIEEMIQASNQAI